jgi:hypothetical protein
MVSALHPIRVGFEEQKRGPCAKFAEKGPLFACARGRLKIAGADAAPGQLDAHICGLDPGAILREKITEGDSGGDLERALGVFV